LTRAAKDARAGFAPQLAAVRPVANGRYRARISAMRMVAVDHTWGALLDPAVQQRRVGAPVRHGSAASEGPASIAYFRSIHLYPRTTLGEAVNGDQVAPRA
jgi:hypothetical protein